MNPYDVLGVSPDATDEEIARAYKRQAKRWHPDLHPGDAAAAEQMGRINRAYDDIKAMRQRGQASPGPTPPNYQYSYSYTYTPRGHSPIALIIGIVVAFFLIRLVLSLLFGGYTRSYTVPGYYPGYYGYYQVIP